MADFPGQVIDSTTQNAIDLSMINLRHPCVALETPSLEEEQTISTTTLVDPMRT
jgi:hypothetical protein